MSITKTQKDSSASDTSIGFDYQFYHFFPFIRFKTRRKIGLEVKDDVHVDLANGSLILIQTKHSLQQNTAGKVINLTERDKDLWKTIFNWCKIIEEQSDPIKFIQNTSFQIASNKNGASNPFITELVKIQNGEIKVKDFKDYLKKLADNTSDLEIKSFIERFAIQRSQTLKEFTSKFVSN